MTNPRPGPSSKLQEAGSLSGSTDPLVLPTPIYDTYTAVRCPTTMIFDLDSMLRASTALEEAAIDDLDRIDGECDRFDLMKTTSLSDIHDGEGTDDRTDFGNQPETGGDHSDRNPAFTEGSSQSRNYQHRFRKRKRDEEIRKVGHVRRPKTLSTLVPLALKAATTCRIDYFDLPATDGAYGAIIRKKKKEKPTQENPESKKMLSEDITEGLEDRVYTLEEVQALGVRVFPWNGIDPVPFVDTEGRVFMVLAGRPTDKPGQKKPYSEACKDAYKLLEKMGQDAYFSPQNLSHRRGDYPVINVGVTHGMGTLRPTYLDLHPNTEVVERVLSSDDIQRIASYGSASFALWFPKNYSYYKKYFDSLFEHSGLRKIFRKSVFSSAALNCGPQVCTKRHTDGKNCPFGVCTVTSLGEFNPKTGGHLIVWELGIAVEFPPGSTILLPSATISHSNTPILDGEVRASFTQYTSGGLFRWVDYGFQTEKDLKKKKPTLYREILRLRPDRWKLGVSLYSTIAELKSWVP